MQKDYCVKRLLCKTIIECKDYCVKRLSCEKIIMM